MLVRWNAGPRRYFINAEGYRVLIGLLREETTEFEMFDGTPSQAEEGDAVGWQQFNTCERRPMVGTLCQA